MKNRSHTFVPYVDNGPYPYPPYHLPNERGEPPLPPLRGSFSPPNHDAGLPSRPTRSWRRSAVLDTSDPAAAICLAARRGDVPLLAFLAASRKTTAARWEWGHHPRSGQRKSTLLEVPLESVGYAAECALQGWKLSTNAGSYKR